MVCFLHTEHIIKRVWSFLRPTQVITSSTWSEGDADVSWGNLCAADGGVDLHLNLWLLHELQCTAPPEQVNWQVTALT